MAVRHRPAGVDRCVCASVASYGIGGMEPSGDERGGVAVPGSERGVAGSDMSLPFAGGGRRIAMAVAEFAIAGTLRPVAGSPVTLTAGPGSWPGSVDQKLAEPAETRHCERHRHQRSW